MKAKTEGFASEDKTRISNGRVLCQAWQCPASGLTRLLRNQLKYSTAHYFTRSAMAKTVQ